MVLITYKLLLHHPEGTKKKSNSLRKSITQSDSTLDLFRSRRSGPPGNRLLAWTLTGPPAYKTLPICSTTDEPWTAETSVTKMAT